MKNRIWVIIFLIATLVLTAILCITIFDRSESNETRDNVVATDTQEDSGMQTLTPTEPVTERETFVYETYDNPLDWYSDREYVSTESGESINQLLEHLRFETVDDYRELESATQQGDMETLVAYWESATRLLRPKSEHELLTYMRCVTDFVYNLPLFIPCDSSWQCSRISIYSDAGYLKVQFSHANNPNVKLFVVSWFDIKNPTFVNDLYVFEADGQKITVAETPRGDTGAYWIAADGYVVLGMSDHSDSVFSQSWEFSSFGEWLDSVENN